MEKGQVGRLRHENEEPLRNGNRIQDSTRIWINRKLWCHTDMGYKAKVHSITTKSRSAALNRQFIEANKKLLQYPIHKEEANRDYRQRPSTTSTVQHRLSFSPPPDLCSSIETIKTGLAGDMEQLILHPLKILKLDIARLKSEISI